MGDEVYAFEFTDCTYESAFGVESLHATKRGAYEAMRARLVKEWVKHRDDQLRFGKQIVTYKPLMFAAWRIRTIEVRS